VFCTSKITKFPHVAKITQFQSHAQFKGGTLAVVRNKDNYLLTGSRLNELFERYNQTCLHVHLPILKEVMQFAMALPIP